MTAPVLQARGLTKRYGQVLAVDEVSLQVRPGEIYGFLGLNGAGKSTTMRMVLGMTRPSAGAAYLYGTQVAPDGAPWHRVGYLLDGAHAYPRLTVRQNLEIARWCYGVRDAGAVDRVLELLALQHSEHRRAGQLSLGNAQRVGLARALLHRPELLVLDEPANGLDPAGIVELRDLLRRVAAEDGVAIFVSSHILAEVARLATRIGIIDGGRLLTELDGTELPSRARRRLRVDARDRRAARAALAARGLSVVTAGPGGLELDDGWALAHPEAVAALLAEAATPPTALSVWHEDLEAFFLRLLDEHRAVEQVVE
ncbi:MAG: ATP-binding cassette domain-containing protein [Streptosporangiales bacterium]|nr:ATP-binding cassette domain-containing protein [Streptosporangiales bacterium]